MKIGTTLNELIDDINNSSENEYTFLHVLHKNDRPLFLSKISDIDYHEIFTTKKIILSLWLNIMDSIKSKLNAKYKIYRKAYFGENYYNKQITKELSKDKIVLMYFIEPSNEEETFWQCIKNCYIDDTSNEYTCILLHDNKMEEIKIGSTYHISSWCNMDYKFKNDLF